jgi:2-polyprenyl-3-methyl-5-hydroxy-6-metoxy-1,4-benzoquinol methylase
VPVHQRYTNFLPDQRQFFDELITEDWETYTSADWDYTRTFEVDRLFERIRPKTILDVGCGCGFHDRIIAEYDFVERVDAIDYSDKSILRAEEVYPHPKVRRSVADFRSFRAIEAYELVVSFQVFEHLRDPERYFKMTLDNVTTDGHVVIFTPNKLRIDNLLRLLRGQAPLLCDPMHFAEYTARNIIKMAKQFSLAPAGVFGVGITPLDVPVIRHLSHEQRTRLGYRLPWVASGICVMLKQSV